MSSKAKSEQEDQKIVLERTIRKHGILLEHQVEIDSRDICKDQVKKKGFINSTVSKPLPSGSDDGLGTVEIDVLIETSYEVTSSIQLSEDTDGKKSVEGLPHGAYINDFYLIECKGHSSDGFLLTRAAQNKSLPYAPLLITPENEKLRAQATQSGGVFMTYWFLYKDRPDWLLAPPVIDWAYFYQGIKNGVCKVDNEGSSTNKFLKGVTQLNENIEAFIQNLPKDYHPGLDILRRIFPALVTNAKIRLLDVNNDSKEVIIYDDIPWCIYKNPYASSYPNGTLPIFEFFYVVNSSHLRAFYEYQWAIFDSSINIENQELKEFWRFFL